MALAPAGNTPGLPNFPDENEASARYARWRKTDPFPDVPPALLNSADLVDYIATAGILSPYEIPEQKKNIWLKPASCAIPCTGEVLEFRYDMEQQEVSPTPTRYELGPKQPLRLDRNSITFLHLGTTFRLPIYLAARFNLAIREIHRGLLVGTGPLVDPGYEGRLLIPLHNLTDNPYLIQHEEPVVWVEFTKLSPNDHWAGTETAPRAAELAEFPERKLSRNTPDDYLNHANQGGAISSSIPPDIERAKGDAQRALQTVRNLRWAGVAALAVAVFGAVWPIVSLISDTNDRLDEVATVQARTAQRLRVLEKGTSRTNDRKAGGSRSAVSGP
jgi:deoxycytidine triphosphate deaminase